MGGLSNDNAVAFCSGATRATRENGMSARSGPTRTYCDDNVKRKAAAESVRVHVFAR